MAELFGREDGTARGRGGSMHIFDGERRFMGGYGIVGGNLPLAAGLALASDYKGTDEVTVCMFGDGASNTGNFGETMNLAALWSLPIVFILENNLYGMGTSVERHSAITDFSRKAEGLGVPGVRADGMDVLAMRETVAEHLKIAREERRPTMVEAFTYRFRGHSAADPEVYREKEEVEEWRKRDPIELFADRLEEEGILEEGEREKLRERIDKRVTEAVEFADASDEPPLDSLYDNLYVISDNVGGWYAIDERAPKPFPGERERDHHEGEAKKLAEAGAAYAGQAAKAGRKGDDEQADRDEGAAREEEPEESTAGEGDEATDDDRGEPEEDEG
jgi:pyruvate dehydrogenase E1 component alpha subunit